MLISKASINNIKEILDLYQSLAGKDYCVWDMEYPNYETITFDDGEMLLVRITPDKIDGEYKIEDVTIVPEEMRDFFNQIHLN